MKDESGGVRRYSPTDVGRVLQIWEDASRVGHPFLSETFLELERERIPRIYLPRADTWVYESSGELRGFLSLLGQEIGALFVDPSSHRRGVGRALVEVAQGIHAELEVEVFEKNSGARAFYESCGFALSRRESHADSGLQVLRLRYASDATIGGPASGVSDA